MGPLCTSIHCLLMTISEEIEDYINIISPEEIKENTIEYLNEQLNKAMQSGDMALQRQYLEQIVQYNRNRM